MSKESRKEKMMNIVNKLDNNSYENISSLKKDIDAWLSEIYVQNLIDSFWAQALRNACGDAHPISPRNFREIFYELLYLKDAYGATEE